MYITTDAVCESKRKPGYSQSIVAAKVNETDPSTGYLQNTAGAKRLNADVLRLGLPEAFKGRKLRVMDSFAFSQVFISACTAHHTRRNLARVSPTSPVIRLSSSQGFDLFLFIALHRGDVTSHQTACTTTSSTYSKRLPSSSAWQKCFLPPLNLDSAITESGSRASVGV